MFGQASPQVTRPVNEQHLFLIFGVLVKNKSLFVRVKTLLDPSLFNRPGEEFHMAFVSMLHSYYEENRDMPVKQAALSELVSVAREAYSLININTLEDNVDFIYDLTEGANENAIKSTERYALGLIKELVTDRKVIGRAKTLLSRAGSMPLANASEEFESITRDLKDVNRVTTNMVMSSVPTMRPNTRAYVEFDMSLNFINALTKGGLQRKTASGLLGVFGGGKTTLATHMAASRIEIEWNKFTRGQPYEQVVYANCEGHPFSISYRVLSYLARIPQRSIKDHYEGIRSLRSVRVSDPTDYQVIHGIPLTEIERLAEAEEKIDKIFKIVDFSGSSQGLGRFGQGGVGDIEVAVDSYCQEAGVGVSLFFLDYAKLFIRRWMLFNNISQDKIRHHIGTLPDQIRDQVADKFNCATLILQQFNKEAMSKKAGTLLSHIDASEGSDFGENCHFCFTLSSPTKNASEKTILNLNLSKARDVETPPRMPSLEFMSYRQGLALTSDFRVHNNNIEHVEVRTVTSNVDGPRRRSARAAAPEMNEFNPN
jgi:hypothetical protein